MEDIPIGFGFKIGDTDEMSKIERGDADNIISEDNIHCSHNTNIREYSWVSMRTFNPMTSETAKNEVRETDTKNKFQENNKIAQLESKLFETEFKLSETESKLSEVLKIQSETNVMLNDCLNRLAKLEKLG
jgi:hypothetical protein